MSSPFSNVPITNHHFVLISISRLRYYIKNMGLDNCKETFYWWCTIRIRSSVHEFDTYWSNEFLYRLSLMISCIIHQQYRIYSPIWFKLIKLVNQSFQKYGKGRGISGASCQSKIAYSILINTSYQAKIRNSFRATFTIGRTLHQPRSSFIFSVLNHWFINIDDSKLIKKYLDQMLCES